MKITKIILVILMGLIVVSAVPVGDLNNVFNAPLEQTGKIGKLTINNKISGRIYITLEGPKNYSFFVDPGKTIKEMEQGEYSYSFFADGDTVVGTIKVKSTATLVLKLIRGKLTINNKVGGNVYLTLDGQRDYYFWAFPGKTIHELVPGTYKYSFYAEGGTEKGEVTLKKSGSTLVLKIDKGKLKIKSKYGQNIFVSFSGKVPYFLWVNPGRTVLEMRVGPYKYKYWYDGKNREGTVDIVKKGSDLILEPPKVCECKKNLYNCSDFSWESQAQACFLYCKGQGKGDIHRLDGDNDGRACEALP